MSLFEGLFAGLFAGCRAEDIQPCGATAEEREGRPRHGGVRIAGVRTDLASDEVLIDIGGEVRVRASSRPTRDHAVCPAQMVMCP